MKKIVMTKAWQIARKGFSKFGGKIKDYFAEALRMAWAIVLKGMKSKIGFCELPKGINGSCYFVINDDKGIQVSLLSKEKSWRGKEYIKRNPIERYRTGKNKLTGAPIRMYHYAKNCGDIEIRLNDEVIVIENHIDPKWL